MEFCRFCLFLAPAQFIYSEATPIISLDNACVNNILYKCLVKNTTVKIPEDGIWCMFVARYATRGKKLDRGATYDSPLIDW